VESAVATRNAAASRTRYEVHPEDHFALIRRLRGTGRDIVGAYHSHPASPATPSPTDLSEAMSADFLYVIVSLTDSRQPVVSAYRLVDGTACPVEIVDG
jgi:proteasome lid subunit RPN8/RPN11